MKSKLEIQKAHDVLIAVILGEIPVQVNGGDCESLKVAASALCWVLDHQHNQGLQTVLDRINKATTAAGYILERRNN